jgi:hypothetical protein
MDSHKEHEPGKVKLHYLDCNGSLILLSKPVHVELNMMLYHKNKAVALIYYELMVPNLFADTS